jgi:hypothetical protein
VKFVGRKVSVHFQEAMALSSMPEGFEPMQVDINEENDNDVIAGLAANGAIGQPQGPVPGSKTDH